MLRNTDEEYHQISLEEYFESDVKPNLLAVSKVFAEAKKQMNLAEYKTLVYALSRIRWKEDCPDTLYLDKKDVARVVGITSDTDHMSVDLNRAIGGMPQHSFLQFSDKHKDLYLNGNFVRTVAMFKNVVRIRLEEEFLGLFGNLESGFITMWSEDIYKMRSERSVLFYELLRDNSDTRQSVNKGEMGVKALKELFDIPKEAYTTKDGHFKRTHFEKYVIEPLCEDMKHCKMVSLVMQHDGKFYEKVKSGNRVIAYRFFWTLSLHPAVATGAEVKEIQERVDKNPEVLKVAKDLVKGEKKPKNRFNDFPQRKYSKEFLEQFISNKQ